MNDTTEFDSSMTFSSRQEMSLEDIIEMDEYNVELLQDLISPLVSDPDSVNIEVNRVATVSLYEIHVPQKDRGSIIGRKGILIQSIKELFSAIGSKQRRSIVVELKG